MKKIEKCAFERQSNYYHQVLCLLPVSGAGGYTDSNHFCRKEACPMWQAYLLNLEILEELKKR
jgi:hypothetical protein